jgi:RNA polymerase sigma-70 factor, ECF subfamily
MATTDEVLIAAFQAGRREAFDEIFERYRQPVWGFFRRRVADPEQARELAQDTFLALVENAARYQPRASFRSYLFGIAYNLLSEARRRAVREAARTPFAHEPTAPDADLTSVMWVRDAMAELDEPDREILFLREFESLSYDEISTVTGVPTNTVRSRLFRARAALRERLAGSPIAAGARR